MLIRGGGGVGAWWGGNVGGAGCGVGARRLCVVDDWKQEMLRGDGADRIVRW